MATAFRVPPLLQPYLAATDKEGSMVLMTGVLGASTNWLTFRVLYTHLSKTATPRQSTDPIALEHGVSHPWLDSGDVGVLFISFLRSWAHWYEGLCRFVRTWKIRPTVVFFLK